MRVEHGLGSAAAHDVAVVASVGVVAADPGLELAVELGETVEALAVKCWPVELLQGRALEALAHGVVVGGAWWDADVAEPQRAEVAGEDLAGELRAVIRQHPGELDSDLSQPFDDVVDEVSGGLGRLVAHEQPADGPPGGGVDRGRCHTVPTPLSLPT